MEDEERDVFGDLIVSFHTKLKTHSDYLAFQEYLLLRVGIDGFIPLYDYHGVLVAQLEVQDHAIKIADDEEAC